jgi:hypothetical protein
MKKSAALAGLEPPAARNKLFENNDIKHHVASAAPSMVPEGIINKYYAALPYNVLSNVKSTKCLYIVQSLQINTLLETEILFLVERLNIVFNISLGRIVTVAVKWVLFCRGSLFRC